MGTEFTLKLLHTVTAMIMSFIKLYFSNTLYLHQVNCRVQIALLFPRAVGSPSQARIQSDTGTSCMGPMPPLRTQGADR